MVGGFIKCFFNTVIPFSFAAKAWVAKMFFC